MFRLLDLGRSDVFAYRLSGRLSEDDITARIDALDAVLETHDVVHLYAEVEDLDGIEARALWLDLVYGVRHLGVLRHIGRVALVTDHVWLRRLADLEAALLPTGDVWTFPIAERDEARRYISSAPGGEEGAPRLEDPLATYAMEGWLPDDEATRSAEIWARSGWTEGSPSKRPRRLHAPRFGHAVHRTHVLLRDIAGRLGTPGTVPAYQALRAVLHALRDRLPATEAADLSAQLPLIVRGLFYEGYRPGRVPEKLGREGFLWAVVAGLPPGAPIEARAAVAAVAGALAAFVSPGEWRQVLGALPHEVRELFETPVEA